MYCKKCGKSIPDDSVFCPSCGSAIGQTNTETISSAQSPTQRPSQNKHGKKTKGVFGKLKSLIGNWDPWVRVFLFAVLVVVAIICVFQGINELTSDNYDFYTEHYKDCMKGYEDCIDEAKYAGYLFKSTYENLAESYKEMADEDMVEIWGMRIKAIIFVAVAVVCAVFVYLVFSSKPITIKDLLNKSVTNIANDTDSLPNASFNCEEDAKNDDLSQK